MNWVIGIVIDLVLVGFIAIFCAKGSKDGFAKTLVSFLSFFIAFALAAILSGPIADFTYSAFVEKPAQTGIATAIKGNVEEGTADVIKIKESALKTIDALPAVIKNFIPDVTEQTAIIDEAVINDNIDEIAVNLTNKVVKPATVLFVKIISFVIIFVLASLILAVVAKMLKFVNKIPLLGKANAFLGGVIGFLKALIFVVLIAYVLTFFTANEGKILGLLTSEMVNSSVIVSRISQINIMGFLKLK